MRNPIQQGDVAKNRVALLCLFLAVWVVVIAGRLVQLQVLKSGDYQAYADSQQTRQETLIAPRGAIYDREGNPLAVSLEHESIAINPMRVGDPAVAAKLLSGVFGYDQAALEEKIRLYKENRYGFLWIRRWATPSELKATRAFRGVDWIEYYPESKRHYPKKELASHILGSVGVDGTGLFGMERSMNYLLQGDNGDVRILQDVRRRALQSEITKQPEPGISLRLSIDQRIQNAAEAALRQAALDNNIPSGSLVVMNPNNGDILAMASYPTFDPNVKPKNQAEMDYRFNRAISLEYEPGSVFKVITLAAGLEKTRLRPESIINCGNGSLRLPGRVIRDHHSYPALTFGQVLAKSSNIGAINIAFQVGKEAMYDYVKAFGFGDDTHLPLPYEQDGYVWPMHRTTSQKVYGSILASVAMGHQISATTVQLAQACSVVANGGTLVQPRLILEMRSPHGKVTTVETTRGSRAIRPETAITMRRLMEGVMLEGTGKTGVLPGWTSGGKTGTAQMFDLKQKRYLHLYHSSFMGFAPVQNPAVVVAITLNESRLYGGTVAAPVFKQVASEALRILGVPMDNPATVKLATRVPAKSEVEEGDPALTGQPADNFDPKLLPDTRKQVMAMLKAAMDEDPGLSEWVLPPSKTGKDGRNANVRAGGAGLDPQGHLPTAPVDIATELASAQRAFEEGSLVHVSATELSENVVSTAVPVNTHAVPDFTNKSMREVMAEAMQAGITVQVYGRGVARQQIPAAGSQVRQDVPIRVLFAP